MNGIDGVAGMQYINTAYGRVEREQSTGRPEYTEKVRFRYNKGRVVVAVKEGLRIKAGEELRVAYGWTNAAWQRVQEEEDGDGGEGENTRGWTEGDSRDVSREEGQSGGGHREEDEEDGGWEAPGAAARHGSNDLEDEEGRVRTGREEAREATMTEEEEGGGEARWRGGRRARPSVMRRAGCVERKRHKAEGAERGREAEGEGRRRKRRRG